MRKIICNLFLICAISAQAQQQFTASTPEAVGFSAERLQKLDNWIQEIVKDGIAPNVVTFIARNGKVIHHKAYGFSDIENKKASRTDDIYRIASQSKAITTVGLLQLYEEGKFLLDDPLSKYLPEFSNMRILDKYDSKTGEAVTHAAKNPITIRQLLSHTAGIPYEHPMDNIDSVKVPFFNSLENDVLADVVKRLAKRPLLHEPGERFTYGLGIDIAGRLIEVLSGLPLDKYLKSRIFDPIGMKDTYFYLPDNKKSRLVNLYSKGGEKDVLTLHTNKAYRNFAFEGAKTFFSGGAGLLGTIEDYAKFCQMILNGGTFNGKRILGRKTIEQMTVSQIGKSSVWDRNDGFGLGFEIAIPGSNYLDPASPGSLMWGGMYCSEFTIDPKEKVIALIYTNVHPYHYYGNFVKKFRISAFQALR